MEKEQIAKAIVTNAKCVYHDCHYVVYGYQRTHIPGYDDIMDTMLLITGDTRTEVHAPLKDVILEEEN